MVNELNNLNSIISRCRGCNLCNNRVRTITGKGNPNSPLMIISDYPDSYDDMVGTVLSGKLLIESKGLKLKRINGGEVFSRICKKINFDFNKAYVTSLIRCTPKNIELTDKYIESCFKHLQAEIMLINPKVILLLGSKPTFKFTGLNITNALNKVFNYNGILIVPSYTPKYYLKANNPSNVAGQIARDIKKCIKLLK